MTQGWKEQRIGEIFEVTDFVANGSFATLRENVKYYDTPNHAVLIRLADYSNGFNPQKFVYVDEHAYNFLSKSSLYGGELIMSNVGSVGKVFICPTLGTPMTLAPNSILIRTPNNPFYYYCFLTDSFQQKLLGITTKATLLKFNKTSFKYLTVPVPSFSEQQRIVDILDKEFAKIDELKSNAELNLQHAKDLFQAALKKELEPKEHWESVLLKDICCESRNIKWKTVGEGESFSYIDLTSVDRDTHSISEPQRINKKTAPSRAQRIVFLDDILFATTRPTLKRYCIVPKEYNNQICSTGFCVLRPQKERIIPLWVLYSLASDEFYRYIEPLQAGATYPAVTDNDVRHYPIPLPPLSEQQTIIKTLDELNTKCKVLQDNYTKTIALCDDLKQSLLRKAFNGEL